LKVLDELLRDATAGDPISGIKWTRKTVRQLCRELARRGYQVSHETVRR
jgi:Rhodopirellula transposase DDE domain